MHLNKISYKYLKKEKKRKKEKRPQVVEHWLSFIKFSAILKNISQWFSAIFVRYFLK